jgi:cyanate lyase
MNRVECAEAILDAKRQKDLTFQELADGIGRHVVWTTAAINGQATMDASEATRVTEMLELGPEVAEALQQIPSKGSLPGSVPVDPLIYRLHEITQVYGTSIKAVIHEMFGDGIMSAIDFSMDMEKVTGKEGETRVKITLNGKWLPYKQF